MSARDLFGGIAKHHGCKCGSCRATAKHIEAGFSAWPTGARATPGEAKKIYTAHVNFNWKDARKREGIGATGANFYGVPAGMTRQQVALVLNEQFREPTP